MNCPGGDEDAVTRRHALPPDKIQYRPGVDSLAQLLRRQRPLQAEGDFGFRGGTEDVPRFGFSTRKADRTRVGIVRMNLNGKRLVGEEQFKQERRIACLCVSALIPNLADRVIVLASLTPRTQIDNAPWLRKNVRVGVLNRQRTCPMFIVSALELESPASAAIAQMARAGFSFSSRSRPRRLAGKRTI